MQTDPAPDRAADAWAACPRVLAAITAALLLVSCASAPTVAGPDSDAPERRPARVRSAPAPSSYGVAVAQWRSPEDVNAWIGDRFEYDLPRALQLSETQRMNAVKLPIHPPERFFEDPRGVCVDLARFGVETLREVAPELKPGYLMIEFDPVNLGGHVLRRHWVASFHRAGRLYVFADSKRPGHIAGPYAQASDYIAEYALYRRRPILGYKELPSYQRQLKRRALKQTREDG